ncbi:MAG: hypothetical protein J2P41_06660 [Blastocatellia bacterium]|nr:hypothetical protein [Blastocatellia bacterium]
MAHAEICDDCRREIALARITSALLKAYSASGKDAGEPTDLMARIRTRIRELSEQGAGSWESAVLALRGWIFAFGAVAILLLTMSVQWKLSNSSGMIDTTADDTNSLTNVSEDFISSAR